MILIVYRYIVILLTIDFMKQMNENLKVVTLKSTMLADEMFTNSHKKSWKSCKIIFRGIYMPTFSGFSLS